MYKYLAIVLLFLLFACGTSLVDSSASESEKGAPLAEAQTLPYRVCETDEDCTCVQNGCCDCANGGEDLAINIEMIEIFQENFDCEDVNCILLVKDPPCCSGTVTCENDLCEYSLGNNDNGNGIENGDTPEDDDWL